MRKKFLKAGLLVAVTTLLGACSPTNTTEERWYEKHVAFPENSTLEQKVQMASHLVPTPQQMEWQQMEFTCFLHFGMNTFTGREWGDGKEDPDLFNPSELDCEQWVRSLKEAGFKLAMITAKHHDGFCLWPTATTKHSVASSKWKEGKGDVVRELRDACKKYGLKFGVYLSPWDRNAECYGQGEAYNKFFIEQLTELLTNYGEVHEVWFDGACGEGPNGKKQVYDWDAILKTIHKLQPRAVTAIMGDDVRWVGNEGGLGRATEWSSTVLCPGTYEKSGALNGKLNISATSKDLGSRKMLEKATEVFWYPSEVDVSIRPGWFYHAEQDDQVRSLANLVHIYYNSIGMNSVLLLNIPPDRRGLLHENDVKRIKELSDYVQQTFAHNLLTEGNESWQAELGATREYVLEKESLVNTFLLQEDISKGQRVESFTLEAFNNGKWHFVAEGTTVGYKRLIRFSDTKAEKIRVVVKAARGTAQIKTVGLYYAEPLADQNQQVKISEVKQEDWKIVDGPKEAALAIDGKGQTSWKAKGLQPLVVDMGKEIEVAGFCYAPVQEEELSGTIYHYHFYLSKDGTNWTRCIEDGEFSNIMHNPVPYFVRLDNKQKARYFKLEPLSEIDGKEQTSVGEVGIQTK